MKTFPKSLSILVLLFIILGGMLAEPVRADVSSADRAGHNADRVLQSARIVDLKSATTIPPPTPKTPSGSITVTKPKYTWTKVAGATNYFFQIFKGSTMIYTSPVLAASVCGATTCSNTPNKVLIYAAYSWRVAAKVGGNWTAMSAYKNFVVVRPALPPTPKTPGGTITVTKPKYTWTKVAGATNYQFQIRKGLSTIYTSPVLAASVCGATTCSNTPNKVLTYAAHSWRVAAKVGGRWTAWSAYKNFTIKKKLVVMNVLVDQAHTNYYSISSGYTTWKALLTTNGYNVTETTSAITADQLVGKKVFVTPLPQSNFSSTEKDVLLNWVNNGGSLMIIGDYFPYFSGVSSDLGSSFGMTIQSVSYATDNTNYEIYNSCILLYLRNYTTYGSIMTGVGNTKTYLAGPLASSTASSVIHLDVDAVPSNAKIVYARKVGLGRVILLGDSNFWDDTNGMMGTNALGNKKFALRSINWLATGNANGSSAFVDVTLDESLLNPPANLELDPALPPK